jgi:hypothetical protein
MKSPEPSARYRRLRWYNLIMGVLHLAQGLAILALSNDFSLPVHATFMEGPPGAEPASLHHLFDLRIGPAVAAFVLISALAHGILVLPGAALVALFGVNASMIFFGLVQEHTERPGEGKLLPFWLGCIAGAVPWVAIGLYFISPGSPADPPAFVYGIFISLFLFFNVFALNMWLQYRRVGPWRNYLFGEAVYVFLSLTAKSALDWQVFFPTLVD